MIRHVASIVLVAPLAVAGARTLIFDPAAPAAAPQVVIAETPPDAVPPTSLFVISIGPETGGTQGAVTVSEQTMILETSKTAKP